MELETAARRMLLAHEVVTGYVGQKVFKYSLLEHVQGTGGRAIVLNRSGGWSVPDQVQTSEFPLLVVDFWADASRTPDGEVLTDNAIDNAYAMYRAVDPLLHRIRDVWWGAGGSNPGLRIVTSMRDGEPSHSNGEDIHTGNRQPGTPVGDTAVVTATYAVHTVH